MREAQPLGEREVPPARVVGLRYEPDEGLPEVILKGAGPLAEEILRRRRAQGAAVVKDDALLDALYRLPIDSEIGPELFEAVAKMLAHVFAVEGKMRGERR